MRISARAASAALLILVLASCAPLATPPAADFAKASAALQQGDYPAAAALCRPAAAAGEARCETLLGHLYARGLGVRPDAGRAAQLFLRASAAGLPEAEMALARLYAEGEGVGRDPEEAFWLAQRAARSGYLPAQLQLALWLEEGRVLPRDPIGAYIWLRIAAQPSTPAGLRDDAALKAQRLAKEIPPQALAEARRRAAAWRPGEEDPAARPGGAGVLVDGKGDLVASGRVVADCRAPRVFLEGEGRPATFVGADGAADLAILRIPGPVGAFAPFARPIPVKAGKKVMVFVYPLHGLPAAEEAGLVAGMPGTVSALDGADGKHPLLRIDAKIGPGDAGSPVVDEAGAVIGLVSGKFDGSGAARGTVPGYAGIAVAARPIEALLDKNRIEYERMGAAEAHSPQGITRAGRATVKLVCAR